MKNKDEFAAGKGLCKRFEGGEERRRWCRRADKIHLCSGRALRDDDR